MISLLPVAAVSLAFQAAPQSTTLKVAEYAPVTGPVKDAGIYHVSSGTWTRAGSASASFGPDVIYDNTAWSGYFSTTGGSGGSGPIGENFDEGQIPSSSHPLNLGGRETHLVNCFQIGYCDFGVAGGSAWDISFYNSYTPCSLNTAPDATYATSGLPAGGCWLVTFDLSGGNEFCLAGDAGDGYDDDLELDSFGWSYTYTGQDPTVVAGFLIRGDPQNTDPNWVTGGDVIDATNTVFGPPSLCTSGGTGLGTRDFWWIEDPTTPANSGCYFFFGYLNNNLCQGPQSDPYASFHLELQADIDACELNPGVTYCQSNPNSTGVNTSLATLGSAAVADNNLELFATLPTFSFGFFITSQTAGFVANPAGSQGNLCVVDQVGRFVAPGQIKSSGASGTISLSTGLGDWSVNAIPTPTGPYAAMAGIRSHFQLWHRDDLMGTATSNFSDGVYIDWE